MDEVIEAFLHLMNDTESYVRKSSSRFNGDGLANFLHDFSVKRINPLFRRIKQIQSQRYVISLVGLTNVGKSTLAHALLEHPVAPIRNGTATSIPVEYEFSDDWLLETHCRKTQKVMNANFKSAKDLSESLKSKVFVGQDHNSNVNEGIERIIVRGPMELLQGNIVFADTPGFGAYQSGDTDISHNEILIEYLKKNVHEVMFCLNGSNAMVSHTEASFFSGIQEMCFTVVVTKWDSEPDEHLKDIERYKKKFSELFPDCSFMFVEAKRALEGKEDSYIDELKTLITEGASSAKRINVIKNQFEKAYRDLNILSEKLLLDLNIRQMPWHKASLPRFKKVANLYNIKT